MKLNKNVLGVFSLLLSAPIFAKPIDAMVKLKDRVSMESLAQNVSDPNSSHFGKFYTPAEIRDLSAPDAKEYASLLQNLKQEGFQIVSESKTHLWLTVRGEPALFQSVFGTEFALATSRSGEEVHQLLREAVVPSRLSLIDSVAGLDNTRKSKHHHVVAPDKGSSRAPGGISPAAIKTAYGFDSIYTSGINGSGQDIAVATYDGFMIDDVNAYYRLLHLTPAPAIDQVQFNGVPKYDENSATETQLDAEFSGMVAPGAKVHVFASAANSDLGELQLFTAILDDNRAKVVNYSWGDCEIHVAAAHQAEMTAVFNRAVAQGVNILAASGDTGSDGCRDGTLNADWPAAHPSIVAIGGTTLTLAGSQRSEGGWSGSGGGISSLFDLPVWQHSLQAPFVKRSFPDVAFNADPSSGQAVYAHAFGFPMWEVIGGTSMAAPQWAGFLALVGQARQNAGKSAIGFLNPVIYGIPAATQAQVFKDVTTGNNGAYNGSSGWDALTGLGSMQGRALLDYLANQ